MNLLQFAIRYKRLVLFGFALTFFSSFGQTFLVSLFVPGFLDSFGISNTYFGSLYSAATLGSAFVLAWAGALIDKVPLKRYALAITAGYVVGIWIIASSQWIWMLFIGLLGLRLFGQGLCGHTAHTAIGRYFFLARGRALSLINLGFSFGEAVLPLTITALIGAVGWRMGWTFVSFFVLLLLPAIIVYTLGRDPREHAENGMQTDSGNAERDVTGHQWRRKLVLRDRRFYLFLPGAVAAPFLLTGFFLYQTQLADFKGWNVETMATAFVAFAVSKSVSSLLTGSLIDRFSACQLFPFFLIPLLAGFGSLLVSTDPVMVYMYMFLAGVSMGAAFTIKTALYVELYGTANLGTIRSMMAMFMVISTAISPILFGLMLDAGYSFALIIKGAMAFVILSILLGIFIYREAGEPIH